MKDVVHDLECEIENLEDETQELDLNWEYLKHWISEWNEQLKKPNTLFLEYHSTEKTLTAILEEIDRVEMGIKDND